MLAAGSPDTNYIIGNAANVLSLIPSAKDTCPWSSFFEAALRRWPSLSPAHYCGQKAWSSGLLQTITKAPQDGFSKGYLQPTFLHARASRDNVLRHTNCHCVFSHWSDNNCETRMRQCPCY